MASSGSSIVFIATLAVLMTSICAKEYVVGDEGGWSLEVNYKIWASDKVFFVGDTLVFNYASGYHNVMEVNATGFQRCTVSSWSGTLTSGRDVIQLQTPGRKWYICGVGKHCELGNMKLFINVLPQQLAPAPTPTPSPLDISASAKLALPTVYAFLVSLFATIFLLFV